MANCPPGICTILDCSEDTAAVVIAVVTAVVVWDFVVVTLCEGIDICGDVVLVSEETAIVVEEFTEPVNVVFDSLRLHPADNTTISIAIEITGISFLFSMPECSICGKDIRRCPHVPFQEYETGPGSSEGELRESGHRSLLIVARFVFRRWDVANRFE